MLHLNHNIRTIFCAPFALLQGISYPCIFIYPGVLSATDCKQHKFRIACLAIARGGWIGQVELFDVLLMLIENKTATKVPRRRKARSYIYNPLLSGDRRGLVNKLSVIIKCLICWVERMRVELVLDPARIQFKWSPRHLRHQSIDIQHNNRHHQMIIMQLFSVPSSSQPSSLSYTMIQTITQHLSSPSHLFLSSLLKYRFWLVFHDH